nr:PIN domain-containing protein [Candidatus Sigynarchaeota archaeon]
MVPRACLDAGVIALYFQQDPPEKIVALFQSINNDKIEAVVPEPILIEVFKNLCVPLGKDFATSAINTFFNTIKARFVSLSRPLIVSAGKLKCQHRSVLSYNDAIVIAASLQEKATLHTTEKELPKIPGLNVVKYEF